jgi:N-acylneuraminate cytidylyltransferase
MPDYTAIDIDEEEDWLIAEKLMKKFILKPEKKDISLFLSDVDGTLTDAGMYYDQNGNELKKFNTRDGKGFELLRSKGIKTGLITSENTKIVDARAKKLNVDFVFQNVTNKGKLEVAQEICDKLGITLENVAYIGDDINCIELLEKVGVAGCPKDAVVAVKAIPKIKIMKNLGGQGAVREFAEYLIQK